MEYDYEYAHFFDINPDDIEPLNCHINDCTMNVFTLLKLLPRSQTINMANTTNSTEVDIILSFLSDTYGVNFRNKSFFELTPRMDTIMIDLEEAEDELMKIIPEGKAVIMYFNKNKETGHTIILCKLDNEIYYVDPQHNTIIPFFSDEMGITIIKNEFTSIVLIESDGHATRNTPDIKKLYRQLQFNTNMHRIKMARTPKTFSRIFRHIAEGNVIQHKNLISGQKYKVINKTTYKQLGISTFLKFENNYAFFEDFTVSTALYSFIKNKGISRSGSRSGIGSRKGKSFQGRSQSIHNKRKIRSI
jgi:hypothetical protein